MPRLRDIDLRTHLADPASKQAFVTPMFDLIASRYDAFTRLFSFGMDRRWKSLVLSELCARVPPGARVIDVACGTGDLALAAWAALAGATVTGIDAAASMVALARARALGIEAPGVEFLVGDLMHLPVTDGSADAVTAGYAFRNVPDHKSALAEVARALRAGGVLVTLDFYRPQSPAWRVLFLGYLRAAGNIVGWWWHREPVAYGYIAPSIDSFVSSEQFTEDLRTAGFTVRAVHAFLRRGVAIHVATRDDREAAEISADRALRVTRA